MYGCEHEVMNKEHKSFSVIKSGLFLDISRPFIGGSSDRMVHCLCCGKGALEIKCLLVHTLMIPLLLYKG